MSIQTWRAFLELLRSFRDRLVGCTEPGRAAGESQETARSRKIGCFLARPIKSIADLWCLDRFEGSVLIAGSGPGYQRKGANYTGAALQSLIELATASVEQVREALAVMDAVSAADRPVVGDPEQVKRVELSLVKAIWGTRLAFPNATTRVRSGIKALTRRGLLRSRAY